MTTDYLKNAPDRLIRAHRNREIRNGRIILERLLCDERMRTVWKEFARHNLNDEQWLEVWQAISWAKSNSNKTRNRKKRGDERDDYQMLAQRFAKLAKKIENGPLDVNAYELLPQSILDALHISNFHELDVLERSQVARRLLPCWPAASELLYGLEMLALARAVHAMEVPRPDKRDSGKVAARTFVWYLGQEFQLHTMFGKQMLGSLRTITNVIFNGDEEFSRSFVQNALRGCIAKRGAAIVR